MKKRVFLLLVIIMIAHLAVFTTGCKDGSEPPAQQTGDGRISVCLLINGNLGDKSFFDSANDGMTRVSDELGLDTQVVVMGTDQSKWEPTLVEVSKMDYDLIIVGTWQMSEPLQRVSKRYPDKKYIIFDIEIEENKAKDYPNVHSILYKQNEGGFLAGALAARVAGDKTIKYSNATGKIGFIGGMDIDIINDFMVGYIEGAKYANPEIKVVASYVGDFFNSAKGKELAMAQYEQQVDIIFSAASQAGLGAIDAAKVKEKLAIGVDSDQSMVYAVTDEVKSNLILTSVLKRVDVSLFNAVQEFKAGTLEFGIAKSYGLADNIIAIAKSNYYEANVPEDLRTYIDELETLIIEGEIVVPSALSMTAAEITALRKSVNP